MRNTWKTRSPILDRKRTTLLLFLFWIWGSQILCAQTQTIKGTVTDPTGDPLPYVTVMVTGTTRGTVTDLDGNFEINASMNEILEIKYVGFITRKVTITQTTLLIQLEEDTKTLEEVVVIGYGTQRKRDLTGAVSSIDNKQIEERQAVNIFDALQGAAPGVQITSTSGAPGAESNIQIRGASSFSTAGSTPLYVVDGVIVSDIDGINPNDIQSLEILKDAASASIYGARSANGVIIITTKSGESGKAKIDVRYYRGYSMMANTLPQVNAFERVLNMNGSQLTNPENTLEKFNASSDSVGLVNSTNYYYQDYLTRTAVKNDVNATISGGASNVKYMATVGYKGEEGIILTSYNNRLTGRFNIDFNATDNLRFMTRISFSHSKTNNINEGNVFQTAMRRPPNMIMYYPDGSFAPHYAMGGNRNPLQEIYARERENERYQGVIYQGLEYKFLKNFSFQASVTANMDLRRNIQFNSKELESDSDESKRKNTGSDRTNWNKHYSGDAFLSYNNVFNKDHSLQLMVGSSVEEHTYETLNFAAENYVSESVHTINMGNLTSATTATAQDYAMASFFGRASYNYKSRYLLNLTGRYDGSSRFGKNERWGFFPSVSAGWRFSDEFFLKWASDWLTDAKIRASYGKTGNDEVGYYEARTRYTSGASNNIAYNGVKAVTPVSVYGNPSLRWEETTQTNIGLDLNLWNGKVSFVADYYVKNTNDLLSNFNLPYTTGYNTTKVNLASIENKGVELMLSVYPVQTKDVSWLTTFTWSKNKNKITKLSAGDYVESSYWYVAEGHPAGQWYGYKNLGIYEYDCSNAYVSDYSTRLNPVLERDGRGNVIIGADGQPNLLYYTLPSGQRYEGEVKQLTDGGVISGGGDVIWANLPDENGEYDGTIDDNDRQILGKATPDWYGSWGNTISYKNFTFSFNFYISWGGLVYNNLKRYYTSWGGNTHMQHPEYILTGWKYQGQITPWYALDTRQRSTSNRRELSDFYLEDGSFIRLRDIRLSYNVERRFLDKIGFLNSALLYVYGSNVLTWTNYSGFDPEVGGDVLTPNRDNNAYPKKREFGFGINIGF